MKSKEIYVMHAGICQCLANPKRLEIIHTLRDRELAASELAGKVGISKANMSQHLAMMRAKGILKGRRDGTNIYYALVNPKVIQAFDIMREVLFDHFNKRRQLMKKMKL